MDGTGDKWANELMETEDQLQKEMREEFRRRLARRLQERLETKERGLSEVHSLKKKDGRAAPAKHLRRSRAPGAERLLPYAKTVGRSHSRGLGTCKESTTHPGPATQALLHGGGDGGLREGLNACRRMGL